MIIITLLILLSLFVPFVFIIFCLMESAGKKAKKKAREVLSGERTMSQEHIGWLLDQLAASVKLSPGDLETADLWHKLQELKCQTAKKF